MAASRHIGFWKFLEGVICTPDGILNYMMRTTEKCRETIVTWQLRGSAKKTGLCHRTIKEKGMFRGLFGICAPIHLNGWNDVLFTEKSIWLVCEKLTTFPYGQDIVGNVVLLAFCWYSQVQDRSGSLGQNYKNVTVVTRKIDFPQHAVQRWRHGDHRLVGLH